MSRLEAASKRFHAALENLQKTAAPLAAPGESVEDISLQLLAVTEERDKLLARVAELEEEARTLTSTTHEVEGRLDGAISEIRAALGR